MNSDAWIRFIIPLIIAIIVVYFFPMSNKSGIEINARPPAYVFGIVWSILYIFIGIAWSTINPATYNRNFIDFCFIILNIILAAWVIVYTKNGANPALYVLLVILGFIGMMIWYLTIQNEYVSAGFLQPLFYWCLFAMLLNFTEVNMKKQII
jgi:tryptophan-rich sensory protein